MPEQDYKSLNVEEVLEAVQNGDISAKEALELEKLGKNRKTLVEALEELTVDNEESQEPTQDETPEEEPELITVKLIENVKLGTDLFKAGDKLGVDEKVYETLVKSKVIAADESQ